MAREKGLGIEEVFFSVPFAMLVLATSQQRNLN